MAIGSKKWNLNQNSRLGLIECVHEMQWKVKYTYTLISSNWFKASWIILKCLIHYEWIVIQRRALFILNRGTLQNKRYLEMLTRDKLRFVFSPWYSNISNSIFVYYFGVWFWTPYLNSYYFLVYQFCVKFTNLRLYRENSLSLFAAVLYYFSVFSLWCCSLMYWPLKNVFVLSQSGIQFSIECKLDSDVKVSLISLYKIFYKVYSFTCHEYQVMMKDDHCIAKNTERIWRNKQVIFYTPPHYVLSATP